MNKLSFMTTVIVYNLIELLTSCSPGPASTSSWTGPTVHQAANSLRYYILYFICIPMGYYLSQLFKKMTIIHWCWKLELLQGRIFSYPITRSDLRPCLDLNIGGQKFKISITAIFQARSLKFCWFGFSKLSIDIYASITI